jgi:hypothetical protein
MINRILNSRRNDRHPINPHGNPPAGIPRMTAGRPHNSKLSFWAAGLLTGLRDVSTGKRIGWDLPEHVGLAAVHLSG